MERPQDRSRPAEHLIGAVPIQMLGAGIPADHRAIRRYADDRIVGGIDDRRQQRAGRICLPTLGDVLNLGNEIARLALGIAHEEGLIAQDETPKPDEANLATAAESLRAATALQSDRAANR